MMINETIRQLTDVLKGEDAQKFMTDAHISVNDVLPRVEGSLFVVGAEIQRVFDPKTDIHRAIDFGYRSR